MYTGIDKGEIQSCISFEMTTEYNTHNIYGAKQFIKQTYQW